MIRLLSFRSLHDQRVSRLLALGALLLAQSASAALQVFPTRLVLSDLKRVTNISLRHLGDQPGHYKIGLIFYRMSENGSLELVDKPGADEHAALNYFRFSPRAVTLKPGLEQVVRIVFSGPKDLPDGEYRAHLHFVPEEAEEQSSKAAATDKINMQLQAKVAVAVPVIYRKGQTKVSVKLSNLSLIKTADKKHGFSLTMESLGNSFPYGDLVIKFTPDGGSEQTLGLVKGVSSYIAKRTVTYPLVDVPPASPIAHGTLRVEMRDPEEQGGKLLASVDAKLP